MLKIGDISDTFGSFVVGAIANWRAIFNLNGHWDLNEKAHQAPVLGAKGQCLTFQIGAELRRLAEADTSHPLDRRQAAPGRHQPPR